MTRERKEIYKLMDDLARQEEADRALGCGYTAADFGLEDPFEKAHNALWERLAATYGMTGEALWEKHMEISDRLMATGVVPFF